MYGPNITYTSASLHTFGGWKCPCIHCCTAPGITVCAYARTNILSIPGPATDNGFTAVWIVSFISATLCCNNDSPLCSSWVTETNSPWYFIII
jgi:hypothetical protein